MDVDETIFHSLLPYFSDDLHLIILVVSEEIEIENQTIDFHGFKRMT
jgi:hypothetical protein